MQMLIRPAEGCSSLRACNVRRLQPPSRCRHLTTGSAAGTSTSQAPTPKPAPSSSSKGISTLATAIAVGVAGYGLALAFPPSWHKLLYPAPLVGLPSRDSKEGIKHAQMIEDQLQNLDIVKKLREETLEDGENSNTSPNVTSLEQNNPVSKVRKWKEMRPYSKVPEERKLHSLTQSTLRGPGMFAVPALAFFTHDSRECIAIMHLGSRMCGHNGIIHGGLLATILDEAVARPAFFSLPNRIAMTAYLNVRYKAPTQADQFVVVKARCHKSEGRKAWVSGEIETLDGQVLVEADALYVEPRNAWVLAKSTAVREALEDAGE